MDLFDATASALAGEGALARAWPDFRARAAQQRLADAVAHTLLARGELIAEAGTGTGKTYAYLVPALLSGLRVIVSTGTRALQDQLYHRDLPRLREALGVGLKTALLKGRSNYLCWYRLERARTDRLFSSREQAAQLARVAAFAGASADGDIAGIDFVPEDSALWPQLTSTPDNCLGSECPFYADCFVVKARALAQAADVVVVNHHLLFADLALKREGFGEILPGAHAFVIDEAHQLPELATRFFGQTVTSRQLQELGRDALAEALQASGAISSLQPVVDDLERCLKEFRLAWDPLPSRGPIAQALRHDPCADSLEALEDALRALVLALEGQAERSTGLAACFARGQALQQRFNALHPGAEEGPCVRWFELARHGFSLNQTPLDIAGPLSEFRAKARAAWVFTSATLAVGGSFDHYARQLGLEAPQTLLEPSPFDYARQSLAYLPPGLPDPAERGYVEAILRAALPVLQASRGRAFLLFTSHRALREAADWLQAKTRFPLFVQGSQPRHTLLQAFRDSGNGVLLGAASFWEGVDVAGDALSVVLIDKLPFAAPDDPVLEARLDHVKQDGGNPFRDWQLPTAVIAFKQGVGRLIRTESDRGVLVLCDPRLTSKSYGRSFMKSLPPLPRTADIEDVRAFFSAPQICEPEPEPEPEPLVKQSVIRSFDIDEPDCV
jgi:ATP-dependent DNA helicase DinG